MTIYKNARVNISEGQIDKIQRAVQAGSQVSIRLKHEDLTGEHILALTQRQINKINKAYENGTGVDIKMSKTQLQHNAKVEGGFLPLILPALATAGKVLLSKVLPALATGALGGIGAAAGSKAVDKITGSGNTMYLKKGNIGAKVSKVGKGLHLAPWKEGSSFGEGLYLKKGNAYVHGSGLLLGENSPFKDIPILGLIL